MNIGDKFTCLLDPKKRGIIVRLIKSAGEADLFEVLVDGQAAALKLFFPAGSTPAWERHCRWLIEEGPTHPAFVYPHDLVRTADGRLGMFMPLIPPEFHQVSELADLPDAKRPLLRNTVKACLNIVLAYHSANRAGYNYVDVSAGQIMVSATGAVKICDVSNIVDKVTPAFNLCTFGYTAPELWLGKTLPSVATGRYSLGIVLFELLLCGGHPLYGRRLPRILGPDDENQALHISPLFIFDPNDDSNSADPEEHAGVLAMWSILTTKLRNVFIHQFTAGIKNPNQRVLEIEWIDALVDMYSACFLCACGAEVFWDPAVVGAKCWHCGATLPRPTRLKLPNRREIVLTKDTVVTRYDITGREVYEFRSVGTIVCDAVSPGSVELLNVSQHVWSWRRGTGPERAIPPRGKAPLVRDATITFFPGSTAVLAT
jgi:eukaryotic-like serine/threonine-protein kinase